MDVSGESRAGGATRPIKQHRLLRLLARWMVWAIQCDSRGGIAAATHHLLLAALNSELQPLGRDSGRSRSSTSSMKRALDCKATAGKWTA